MATTGIVQLMTSIFTLTLAANGWPLVSIEYRSEHMASQGQTIVELEAGPHYRSGTRVGSSSAGVSFIIPDAWQAAMPPRSDTVFLESPHRPGMGLVAVFRHIAPQQLEDHLNQPQVLDEGYVLHPVESAKRSGDRITVRYHSGENTGRALALFGPSQNGALYLFTGPKDQADYYREILEQIAASTQFVEQESLRPSREDQT